MSLKQFSRFLPLLLAFFALLSPQAAHALLPSNVTVASDAGSPSKSLVGQAVKFTATVSGAGTTPGGSVQFNVDGNPVKGDGTPGAGPVTLSAGTASFTTSSLAVGTRTITADYGGDVTYNSKTSAPFTHQVLATTSTSLTINPSATHAFGVPVSYLVTVSNTSAGGSGGTPTGSVTVKDENNVTLGTGVLGNGGTPGTAAVGSSTNLTVTGSPHLLTATYTPTGNFDAGTAGTAGETVTAAGTTTTMVSVSPQTIDPPGASQSVSFTAHVAVSVGSAPPVGTVQFLANGSSVGAPVALNGGGNATLSGSLGIASGSYNISAQYNPTTDFTSSASANTIPLTVRAVTTVSVSANPAASVFGQSVQFTATLSSGNSTPLTNSVQFFDNGSPLGSPVSPSLGTANLSVSTLTVGQHTITARYPGDSNNAAGSGALAANPFVVSKADTSGIVTPTPSSAVSGQTVSISATVTAQSPGGGAPSGSVSFTATPTVGNPIALGPGNLSGGTATVTTNALTATGSPYTITATYGGDANFNAPAATPTATVTVGQAGTHTAVTATPSSAAFDQTIQFKATVTAQSPGGGAPSGSVSFTATPTVGNPIALGPGNLSGGTATVNYSTLPVGGSPYTITATYTGDNDFTGSSNTTTVTVGKEGTTTTVASVPNPSTFNQQITFTATVNGNNGGTPTGNVTFRDGGNVIGAAPSPVSGGVATLQISTLTAGQHTITASFTSTDPNFADSLGSLPTPQTVGQAATTTAITSTNNSDPAAPVNTSTFGQSVTLTATVASPAGAPTGTVSFDDTNGTLLGTVTLNGLDVATFTTTQLSLGQHAIKAVYNSDGNYQTSNATLSPPQTVNQAANTIVLASSSATDLNTGNPTSFFGQSVTFAASVLGGSAGVPTGTVDFFDGPAKIGSGSLDNTGKTSFTTFSLAAGTHPVTAKYNGDTNNAPKTSAAVSQIVSPAPTTTVVTSSNTQPVFGSVIQFTAQVSNTAAGSAAVPTGTIQFQVDGNKVKADGTGGAQDIPLDTNARATFSTNSLPVGAYKVTAVFTNKDGNFVKSDNLGAPLMQPVNNAAPTVTRLTPNAALVNDPSFIITITGSGFVTAGGPASVKVDFNHNMIPADTVSADGTSLTATVLSQYLNQPGNVQVGVVIPQPQGTSESNTLPFEIRSSGGPALFSINPSSVLIGLISSSDSLRITLKGSSFTAGSRVSYTPVSSGQTVIFDQTNSGLTVVDPTTLTFSLPGSFLQGQDTATITVRNPDPNGGGDLVSGPVSFVIGANPVPTVASLNPTGISVNGNPGTNTFTLTLNGANFLRGAQVLLTDPNGVTTVFGTDNASVNATGDQITVSVPNALVPQAGRYPISARNVQSLNTATNPPSYSYNNAVASSPQSFTVTNRVPIISAFSPGYVVAGATVQPNRFNLTITGSNFDPGVKGSPHSTVVFNNTTLGQDSVQIQSSTTLVASVDPALVSSAGLATVSVVNFGTDGNTQIPSAPVSFPINPVYARATFPSRGIVMFSLPYDYSGNSPFDILKEVTFGPGLTAGAQYFGLGTTPNSNILSGLQDLPLPAIGATRSAIAQWSPQGLVYLYGFPNKLDLQLQLGRAYWGVGITDKNGPSTIAAIRIGAPATVNPYPVPLARGWNMVGDPFPTSVSISTISVQRAGTIYKFADAVANGLISLAFWSYEGGTSYTPHYPGKLDPTNLTKDTLDPFAGYWLLCNTDCQLLVPRP